jgi:hypothetical protein
MIASIGVPNRLITCHSSRCTLLALPETACGPANELAAAINSSRIAPPAMCFYKCNVAAVAHTVAQLDETAR